MTLRDDIEAVLALADQYSITASPPMEARDRAIARIAARLNDLLPDMTVELGLSDLSLTAHGGGRQANYSPSPWVRIFTQAHSPSAMEGFYLVYLFATDGSAAYLSLNQGTSELRSNHMRPINRELEVRGRAADGRRALGDLQSTALLDGASLSIDLASATAPVVGAESRMRVRNYEIGNIVGWRYESGAVPPDAKLLEDLSDSIPLLARLYGAAPTTSKPPATPTDPAITSAAARTRARHRGRLQDPEVRAAIELHAEDAAITHLGSEWIVTRVGNFHRGYDLECHRGEEELHVEVKGTQLAGVEVTLTRNEVHHHVQHGGSCSAAHALFILSSIAVVREPSVSCVGGTPRMLWSWSPAPEDLTPTEYAYRVPSDL